MRTIEPVFRRGDIEYDSIEIEPKENCWITKIDHEGHKLKMTWKHGLYAESPMLGILIKSKRKYSLIGNDTFYITKQDRGLLYNLEWYKYGVEKNFTSNYGISKEFIHDTSNNSVKELMMRAITIAWFDSFKYKR